MLPGLPRRHLGRLPGRPLAAPGGVRLRGRL